MADQKTPAQLLLDAAQRAAQVRQAAVAAATRAYAPAPAPAATPPAKPAKP